MLIWSSKNVRICTADQNVSFFSPSFPQWGIIKSLLVLIMSLQKSTLLKCFFRCSLVPLAWYFQLHCMICIRAQEWTASGHQTLLHGACWRSYDILSESSLEQILWASNGAVYSFQFQFRCLLGSIALTAVMCVFCFCFPFLGLFCLCSSFKTSLEG